MIGENVNSTLPNIRMIDMEKDCYQEIIAEVSKKLSEKFISTENNLPARSILIDSDILEIVRDIGLQTTKNILESTLDELVQKIKEKDGLAIHRNPSIDYNTIFGKLEIDSPYLWAEGICSKPLFDEMKISSNGRSEAVNRALSDFGIEDSFGRANKRFKEHYHYDIGSSAVDRSTKKTATQAMEYMEKKLSSFDSKKEQEKLSIKTMLVELDGCEIRTVQQNVIEGSKERTPVYDNPKKEKIISWRDVRLGFVRPIDPDTGQKIFVGKMDSYPVVINQLHNAAVLIGMTQTTHVVGVADGGNGLSEELKRQFSNMQFVLDKSHLKDHFYETAEEMGICKDDRPKWVNPRIKAISNGEVKKTMQELQDEYDKKPNQRLKRLLGYIERFNDALNYNEFKEKGYPIGSGEIESAHKSIPQKRLKIPGASWHKDSIDPMLALRILRADDWWDDFWNDRTEKLLAA